jgi:hypothetical protein
MQEIIEDIRLTKNLNLGAEDDMIGSSNYKQRVLINQSRHLKAKVIGYIQEMTLLKNGQTPQSLSEYEAAKKIGLSTILGKHA